MKNDPAREHPSDETIARLTEGKLQGEELAHVEAHLDLCTQCRTLLAVVSNGSAPGTPLERAALAPGEKLGRYEIERLIGAGGMGMLYVARDPQLGRRVALKLMRPAFAGEVGRVRLLREAQAMAQLSHPNVVHVYDIGELSERVFVAMELVEGGTLRDWMKQPRTWKEVLAMFVAAGEGLFAAHRSGVVHRDFKPENVMIGTDGRPRVGDFGLARPELVAAEEPPANAPMRVTLTGTMLGTPAYMSPEQLLGKPADAASDQYGFCVALYEALVGKRPFPADSLEELRALVVGGMPPPPKDGPVPAHVWAAIARGLHPDPSQRFPDLDSLLTVLRLQVSARAAPAPTGWSRGKVAVAAAAFAALSAGVGAFAVRLGSSAPAPAAAASAPVPPPPAARPPPASAAPAPAAAEPAPQRNLPEQLELAQGTQRVLVVPGLQRVAVGDSSVVDLKTIGADQLLLIGSGIGRTTVLVWLTGGTREQTEVTVFPTEKAKPRPGETTLSLPAGAQRVITAHRLQRVAIGDSAVCDVKTIGNDQLMLLGIHEGKTTLLTWTDDGTRQSYLVQVTPEVPVPGTTPLGLKLGQSSPLPPAAYASVTSDDPEVVEVKAEGGKVSLLGKSAGRATVRAKKKDGPTAIYAVLVQAPTNAELAHQARERMHAKDYPGAKKLLQACLDEDETELECVKLMGSVCASLAETSQSVFWYRRYLELAPEGDRDRDKISQLLEAVGR